MTTNNSGWAFPLETGSEAEHQWALAHRLADQAQPDELPLPLHSAFALAVQLHAAQKIAHANEMREAQETRIANAYESLVVRMGDVADALNRIAVAIKDHASEPAVNSRHYEQAPRPRRALAQ